MPEREDGPGITRAASEVPPPSKTEASVTLDASAGSEDAAPAVYCTRQLQRVRRTDVQLAAIDEAIYAIAEEQRPLSVRAI